MNLLLAILLIGILLFARVAYQKGFIEPYKIEKDEHENNPNDYRD